MAKRFLKVTLAVITALGGLIARAESNRVAPYTPEESAELKRMILADEAKAECKLYEATPGNYFLMLPDSQKLSMRNGISYKRERVPFYRCFWGRRNGRSGRVVFDQVNDHQCTQTERSLELSCAPHAAPLVVSEAPIPDKLAMHDFLAQSEFHPARADALSFNHIYSYEQNGSKHYVIAASQSHPYRMGDLHDGFREDAYRRLFVGPQGGMKQVSVRKIEHRLEMDCRDCQVYSVQAEGNPTVPRGATFLLGGLDSRFYPGRSPERDEFHKDKGVALHSTPKVEMSGPKLKGRDFEWPHDLNNLLSRYNHRPASLTPPEYLVLETEVGKATLEALAPRPQPDPCRELAGAQGGVSGNRTGAH